MISGQSPTPTKKTIDRQISDSLTGINSQLTLLAGQIAAKQDQIKYSTYLIKEDDWDPDTKTCQLTTSDITEHDLIIAGVSPTYSAMAVSCGIRISEQSTTSILLLCETLPSASFTVDIAKIHTVSSE